MFLHVINLILNEKDVKMLKKIISTSEWHTKHLFAGHNTQHIDAIIYLFSFVSILQRLSEKSPSVVGLNENKFNCRFCLAAASRLAYLSTCPIGRTKAMCFFYSYSQANCTLCYYVS